MEGQNNRETLKERQETNLSAEIHHSAFPTQEILTTPNVSKGIHFNQCKNVATFQKDNFKNLGSGHWISILNRKEMLHMNSCNLPDCQSMIFHTGTIGKVLKRTANYTILPPKSDPFHSKGKLPSHSRKFTTNLVCAQDYAKNSRKGGLYNS